MDYETLLNPGEELVIFEDCVFALRDEFGHGFARVLKLRKATHTIKVEFMRNRRTAKWGLPYNLEHPNQQLQIALEAGYQRAVALEPTA